MKKADAWRIAKKFKKEHPELAGRPVRLALYPPGGYNTWQNYYYVKEGPRGGMGKSVHISSNTNACIITTLGAGDVLLIETISNGWKSYYSTVILPCDESGVYANHEWHCEFSEEEHKLSNSFGITHGMNDYEY